MNKTRIAGLKSVIIVLVLGVLIVAYYGHLTKKNRREEEIPVTPSVVTDVLLRNLNTNYPSTPKEVVKYFSDVTKCYYLENITDEDFIKLADKMLQIYDDELVANKEYDWYIGDLKQEIGSNIANGYKVSSYELSPSTDVEYFSENGYECARTWCTYNFKSDKQLIKIVEVFILRKDADSHWKIFGWEQVDE